MSHYLIEYKMFDSTKGRELIGKAIGVVSSQEKAESFVTKWHENGDEEKTYLYETLTREDEKRDSVKYEAVKSYYDDQGSVREELTAHPIENLDAVTDPFGWIEDNC